MIISFIRSKKLLNFYYTKTVCATAGDTFEGESHVSENGVGHT